MKPTNNSSLQGQLRFNMAQSYVGNGKPNPADNGREIGNLTLI